MNSNMPRKKLSLTLTKVFVLTTILCALSTQADQLSGGGTLDIDLARNNMSASLEGEFLGEVLDVLSDQPGMEVIAESVPMVRVHTEFSHLSVREGIHKLLTGTNFNLENVCKVQSITGSATCLDSRWLIQLVAPDQDLSQDQATSINKNLAGDDEFGNALSPSNSYEIFSDRLSDPDPWTRTLALQEIDPLKHGEILGLAWPLLHDPDRAVREAALESIAGWGDNSANFIGSALNDPDQGVRDTALELLALFESDDSVAYLKAAATSASDQDRNGAIYALAESNAPAAAPALFDIWRQSTYDARISILEAISGQPHPRFLEFIALAVADSDPRVRLFGAYCAEDFGDPDVVPIIEPLLLDDDFEVREFSARFIADHSE